MHEVQRRARNGRGILELGHRRDVEMPDAGAVESADQERRAVRLVGIGHVARKVIQEIARRATGGMRARGDNGLFGLAGCNEMRGRSEFFHLERTSTNKVGPEAPCEPRCVAVRELPFRAKGGVCKEAMPPQGSALLVMMKNALHTASLGDETHDGNVTIAGRLFGLNPPPLPAAAIDARRSRCRQPAPPQAA